MKTKSKVILAIIGVCLILACAEAETLLLQILWSGSLLVIMTALTFILNHIEKKEEVR